MWTQLSSVLVLFWDVWLPLDSKWLNIFHETVFYCDWNMELWDLEITVICFYFHFTQPPSSFGIEHIIKLDLYFLSGGILCQSLCLLPIMQPFEKTGPCLCTCTWCTGRIRYASFSWTIPNESTGTQSPGVLCLWQLAYQGTAANKQKTFKIKIKPNSTGK